MSFEEIIKDFGEVATEHVFHPKDVKAAESAIRNYGLIQRDADLEEYFPMIDKCSNKPTEYLESIIESIKEQSIAINPKAETPEWMLESAAIRVVAEMVVANDLKIKIVL